MFVYLDESGDTGFKFRKGSSKYFVVTLLLVADPVPLHDEIDEIRKRLGLPDYREFHFVHCAKNIRYEFLKSISRFDFKVRTIIINKQLMTRPHMRNHHTFYNFVIRLILEHDHGTINGATLIIDESVKNKDKKRQLASYLRRELNSDPCTPKIHETRYHTSHQDNLIQAVDMIGGAIYRKYNKGDDRYLKVIWPRLDDVWVWTPYKID